METWRLCVIFETPLKTQRPLRDPGYRNAVNQHWNPGIHTARKTWYIWHAPRGVSRADLVSKILSHLRKLFLKHRKHLQNQCCDVICDFHFLLLYFESSSRGGSNSECFALIATGTIVCSSHTLSQWPGNPVSLRKSTICDAEDCKRKPKSEIKSGAILTRFWRRLHSIQVVDLKPRRMVLAHFHRYRYFQCH